MIVQYRFALNSQDETRINGYHLYGWLMEQLPPTFGEQFHKSVEHPLSQYLYRDRSSGELIWVLNLLSEELAQVLSPVLDGSGEIPLCTGMVAARLLETHAIPNPEALILHARQEMPERRCTFTFRCVTSFRQDGRYVLFPQEQLILNSLIRRWDQVCPAYALTDEDALAALLRGIRISDYRLRSGRYWMKDVKIPGFIGSITLSARLSPPMMEVWRLLCRFAPYAGVGIKTSLGMGGVSVEEGSGANR